MTILEGKPAPHLNLPASANRTLTLPAPNGRPLVLYFYPKADTPGCTKQAQAFQEALPQFNAHDISIAGVSKDTIKAIDRFAAKYELTFPLASDPDGKVVEAYGAWVEKSMYGKSYMGIDRTTVLIDQHGNIAQIWRKVKVPGHATEVLAAATKIK